MEGWIKIHRKILVNRIWKKPLDFRLFFYLLVSAVFDEVRFDDVIVTRGQYLRSYRQLQKDLTYISNNRIKKPSPSTLKRSVQHLVDLNMISTLETKLGTLFTIVNYEIYQAKDSEIKRNQDLISEKDAEHGTGHGTPTEHLANDNKNVKNGKKQLIIAAAKYLITDIQKETSFYSIINKYIKIFGKMKMHEILTGCINREKEFANENRLAAYLEVCKNGRAQKQTVEEYDPAKSYDEGKDLHDEWEKIAGVNS